MFTAILAASAAYAATNIDDLFINMVYFAQAENKKDVTAVYTGKYIGSTVLIIFSMAGAVGATMMPDGFVRWLAVIPLFIGIKETLSAMKKSGDKQEEKIAKGLMTGTAVMTIASGADNVGVYIPLLAGCTAVEIWVTVFVFGIMTGLWCYISSVITDIPALKEFIEKHKKAVVPAVYILLAVYIFFK